MSAVRRAALIAALLGAVLPRTLRAQRPAVPTPLAAAWTRDTVFTAWVLARPGLSLDSLAARVARTGARIRTRSRWLHGVSVAAPAAALRELARDRDLRRIQPLGRLRRVPIPDSPAPALLAADDTCGPTADSTFGPSAMPYRRLNVLPLAAAGISGAGIRIALLDTGFDTAHPAFTGVAVAAQRDFVFGDDVVRDEPADQPGAHGHGTAVWSLLAADVPGQLRGMTRDATYLLAKTEDIRSETRIEEDHFVAALEWADSLGAQVASASLGYLTFDNGFGYTPSDLNGDIAVTTVAVDSAVSRGIVVVTSAGNGGPGFRTLVTPADADSGLAIGAEDSLGVVAGFSSRGPTADGRIKPDFTAPGAAVCVLSGSTVRRLNGTSFAAPLVAAVATLVRQQYPGLPPLDVAAALRRHAASRAAPDSIRGYGRPDAAATVTFPTGVTALAPTGGPLGTVTPTFAWTIGPTPSFAGPVTYRVRIAADSMLSRILLDTTLAETTLDPPRALPPGPLWWRVDAAAGGASAASNRIGPVDVPAWATLRTFDSPAGETTVETQPTLRWTSPGVATPPGPFEYDVFVRRATGTFPEIGVGGLRDTALVVPQPLERSVTYTWWVVTRAGSDSSATFSRGTFLVLDPSAPPATLLYQNFPNPFPGPGAEPTCLWFDLATPSAVTLEILDLRGRPVRTLVPGPGASGVLQPGRYGRGSPGQPACDARFAWDGRGNDGRLVPPGVYLGRFRAGGVVRFVRIVFLGGSP